MSTIGGNKNTSINTNVENVENICFNVKLGCCGFCCSIRYVCCAIAQRHYCSIVLWRPEGCVLNSCCAIAQVTLLRVCASVKYTALLYSIWWILLWCVMVRWIRQSAVHCFRPMSRSLKKATRFGRFFFIDFFRKIYYLYDLNSACTELPS